MPRTFWSPNKTYVDRSSWESPAKRICTDITSRIFWSPNKTHMKRFSWKGFPNEYSPLWLLSGSVPGTSVATYGLRLDCGSPRVTACICVPAAYWPRIPSCACFVWPRAGYVPVAYVGLLLDPSPLPQNHKYFMFLNYSLTGRCHVPEKQNISVFCYPINSAFGRAPEKTEYFCFCYLINSAFWARLRKKQNPCFCY